MEYSDGKKRKEKQMKEDTETLKAGSEEEYKKRIYRAIKIKNPEAFVAFCRLNDVDMPGEFGAQVIEGASELLKSGCIYVILKNNEPYVIAHEPTQQLVDRFNKPLSMEVYKEVREIILLLGTKRENSAE